MKKKILLLSMLCMMGTVQARILSVTCSVHGKPAMPLGVPYSGGDVEFHMNPAKETVNRIKAIKFAENSVIWNNGKNFDHVYKYNSIKNQLFYFMSSKYGGKAFVLIDNKCEDSGKTHSKEFLEARKARKAAERAANPDGGSDVIDDEKLPGN